MKTPIVVWLPADKPNTALLDAPTTTSHQLLEAIGSKKLWSYDDFCWMFPRGRVDDLVAYVQSTNRKITVAEVEK